MSTDVVDKGKRRFLTAATSVVGAVGAGFVAVPFIASWMPSERAKNAGAPVEADISKLEEGRMLIVEWQSKPVWIVRRSQQMLENLPKLDDKLRDPASENADQQPEYAQNELRSRKPEILVLIGICTHLGCSPTYRP
ncbi:MAG: ubiquinol-cytochrome c reductase iron-sulfur subunit, partial [Gammaproteobacteria bacterium]